MPYFHRSMRPRWPPSPCAEDEAVSLSRELHGLSYLGEKPGFEGACARGAVDQKPVLLTLGTPSPPSLVHSTETSSSDDNNGPPTPPPDARQEPFFHSVGDSPYKSSPRPPTTLHQIHPPKDPKKAARKISGLRKPQLHQPASNGWSANSPRNNAPPASSRPANSPKPPRNVPQNAPALSSLVPASGGTPSNSAASSALPKRSGSTRFGRSAERVCSVQRSASVSDHNSDSTVKPKPNQALPSQGNQKGLRKPTGIQTLAQRIEEKLQRRQEQRDSASSSPQEGPNREESPVVSSVTSPTNVVRHSRTTKTPEANKRPIVRQTASTPQSPNRASRSRATSTSRKVGSAEPSEEDDSDAASFSTAVSKPISSNEVKQRPAPPKRTVSFLDEALQSPAASNRTMELKQPRVSPVSSRRNSPSRELTRPPSPGTSGLCLLPCPRSVPMAGQQDWYTISGLEHLDICSSCMRQIGKSRFRDFFIPSIPKSPGKKVRCSFSEPWTRLAWLQTIKQGHEHLNMLFDITRPPSGSSQCSGRIISEQYWHQVVNTETKIYLPDFDACSACVRNIKILMPSLRGTFRRSTVMQEGACAFATSSPRFIQYIDHLDIAVNRAKHEGSTCPDITSFVSYARRKVNLRDCRRDRQVFATWHYMPQLPELTVCEDCYDDAVWPLARANKPIAREFSSMMRLLPGNDGASRCREASCQLYSPRMRAKFRDAVLKNDFAYLEFVALRRFDAEQVYHERREELLDDESLGYDCDLELRWNMEEWKRWE